jgi:hypothetical protein
LKRSDDQRLAERLGIKLKRTGPYPSQGTVWERPWFSYRFYFPTLAVKRGNSIRLRPGASFYGSSFGGYDDGAAWTKALEEYARSIDPRRRPSCLLCKMQHPWVSRCPSLREARR